MVYSIATDVLDNIRQSIRFASRIDSSSFSPLNMTSFEVTRENNLASNLIVNSSLDPIVVANRFMLELPKHVFEGLIRTEWLNIWHLQEGYAPCFPGILLTVRNIIVLSVHLN